MSSAVGPWLAIFVAAAATYMWRGLAVPLSGRIDPDGPLFRWVGCVAFGILAGLIARMILLPVGPLETTPLAIRILCTLAGVGAFYAARRNSLVGVAVGCSLFSLLVILEVGK